MIEYIQPVLAYGLAPLATASAIWLGWRKHFLDRELSKRDMPYLIPDPLKNGSTLALAGPNYTSWVIRSVHIVKPKRARFYKWVNDKESGKTRSEIVGLTLTGPQPHLLVASAEWPVSISCQVALRADSKIVKRLDASLSQ